LCGDEKKDNVHVVSLSGTGLYVSETQGFGRHEHECPYNKPSN